MSWLDCALASRVHLNTVEIIETVLVVLIVLDLTFQRLVYTRPIWHIVCA